MSEGVGAMGRKGEGWLPWVLSMWVACVRLWVGWGFQMC